MRSVNRLPHSRGVMGMTLVVLLLTLALSGNVSSQTAYNHPELKWMTIETEHAIVHYHQGTERTAREVAAIADQIYKPITCLYNYEPDTKINWIIKDTDDYSNGGSFYYDQKIEIWATPLDFELRGTHHWLYNVVTHEFTHMIQLGAARKYPRWMPGVYFQYIGYEEEKRPDVLYGYPNQIISYPVAGTVMPMWLAEGAAQFQVSGLGHDYWDSHRDMLVRTRSLEGKMLTWNQMGVFGKTTLGSESVYNSGYALTRYIAKRWGQDKIAALTQYMSKPYVVTFDQAAKQVLGISGDNLYSQWVKDIGAEYATRTATIRSAIQSGTRIDKGGFASLYPSFSPNGKEIAFMSNDGEDYMSLSSFYIYNVDSATVKKSDAPVKGKASWSADSNYLLYSRQKGPNWNGSSFDDLYLWDIKKEREIRLTVDARLSQPAFSPDGKQIVAILNCGGSQNLVLLDVPADLEHYEGVKIDIFHWGRETGTLNNPGVRQPIGTSGVRQPVDASSARIFQRLKHKQLTTFDDGQQISLPVWSPDGREIYCATSNLDTRDIYRYTLADSSWTPFIATPADERDLVFSNPGHSSDSTRHSSEGGNPDSQFVYYVSDRTGIFNIFRRKLGTEIDEPVTNVTGGAFLPALSADGKLVYSEFTADGYQVKLFTDIKPVDTAQTTYLQPQERESAHLPPAPSASKVDAPSFAYKSPFGSLFLLPRVTWDYGIFKPGFYAYTNDFLDKISLFGGAAMNAQGDRDLYGSLEYRVLKPTLYLEAYNITRSREEHFDDNFVIVGEHYVPKPNGDSLAVPIYDQYTVDYNFVLNEVDIGARLPLYENLTGTATFRWGAYKSSLRFDDGSSFDYTYYTGRQYLLRLDSDARKPSVAMDIHPRGGWRGWVEYAYEDNQFITGFEVVTGKGTISEVYAPYKYHRAEADLQYYYPLFKGNIVLNPQLIGGVISDNKVDPFFHLYAGGLIGLRGYSYYSMGGTRKAVGRFTVRFPISPALDWRFGPFYFDRMHLGLFAEAGDAWNGRLNVNNLKKDVGADVRLKMFSWYGYPTDIQFTAAYGLDKFNVTDDRKNIHTYGNDWRWYFTVLFDFL